MKKLIGFILFISVLSCNTSPQYEINTEKYEESKESMEETEKKAPVKFLQAKINSKKNLLKQTVVRGNILSKAKIVTYKDVEIKLRFFSKTGALLQEDTDTIYETITPGGAITFKSKYFAPRGTDSVAITITDAKFQ